MINRVEIENFRCLKSVDVPLKPLTVLVGPNNTGKTAFLSALEAGTSVNGHKLIKPHDYWLGQQETALRIHCSLTGGERIELEFLAGARAKHTDPREKPVRSCKFFGRDGLSPKMHSDGLNESVGVPTIDASAALLPAYLDAMLRHERRRFLQVEDRLRKLLPGFRDFHIATPQPNSRRIDIEWENGYRMEAQHASYGVKLMIFFVALAMHPRPPAMVLIDEPETGVHPQLLSEIVSLLRGLTDGSFAEHRTQVVMTTHSPYLLDYIKPDCDQVLVAQICDDGSRSIQPIDQDRIQPFMDEFMLGEVWLNRGEEGLLSK